MARNRPLIALVLCVAGLAAVAAAATAVGETDRDANLQAGRQIVAQSRFAVTEAPTQSELVQLVVDFEPGAWTSLHTHGGQAINLVLDGEITLRHGGVDLPHRAGQSWTDSTTQVHAAGNTGSGKARLLTNFLLPKGAPQITVVEDSRFGPTVTYEAKFALPALPAGAEIVQQVADLPADRRVERTSAGFTASIVIEGEVNYQIGADRKQIRAGDAWSAPADTRIAEENRSGRSARVFTAYLLPSGRRP